MPGNALKFQSLQASIKHLASGTGAVPSSQVIRTGPTGDPEGWPKLVALAGALSLIPLHLAWKIEKA